MAERNGDGVRGVGRGWSGQAEDGLDHPCNLLFRSLAPSCHTTFDFPWCVLVDRDARRCTGNEDCAAYLTQRQCGPRIPCMEDALNCNSAWRISAQEIGHRIVQVLQGSGEGAIRRVSNMAQLIHGPSRSTAVNHRVPTTPQRGV